MKRIPGIPKGISLHIGVNALDAAHYSGWEGTLSCAERDAADLQLIARIKGFETNLLVGKDATKERMAGQLTRTAKELKESDFLLLTFSGYGGYVPLFSSESDKRGEETWCLFDKQVFLEEIKAMLAAFPEQMRIIVLADCSFLLNGLPQQWMAAAKNEQGQGKTMPEEIAMSAYLKNKDYYDSIHLKKPAQITIGASVLWATGSQLNQDAYEGKYNGFFTASLKSVWNGGYVQKENYEAFFSEITRLMPPYQTPKIQWLGNTGFDFFQHRPFQI